MNDGYAFFAGFLAACFLFVLLIKSFDARPVQHFGDLREPCYPNSTCNDGLLCRSEICVE